MAKDELKQLLNSDPNGFWRYVVAQKGLDALTTSVLDEAHNEVTGIGVEEHVATYLQEW